MDFLSRNLVLSLICGSILWGIGIFLWLRKIRRLKTEKPWFRKRLPLMTLVGVVCALAWNAWVPRVFLIVEPSVVRYLVVAGCSFVVSLPFFIWFLPLLVEETVTGISRKRHQDD